MPFRKIILEIAIFMTSASATTVAHAQWSVAHLLEARSNMGGVGQAGKAFFGGGTFGSVSTDTIDIFDAASGVWTNKPLPINRFNIAAGAAGGKVLFAGGQQSGMGPALDRVDILDVAAGTWTKETLPFPIQSAASVAYVGTKVFFGGGNTTDGALNVAQEYDVSTGQWTIHSLGPDSRKLMAATQDDRRVFFAGGGVNEKAYMLNVYDTITQTWSIRQTPHPHVGGAGAVVIDGLLYISGGNGRAVDVLDIESGTWSALHMPHERDSVLAGAAGPFAVFAGGGYYDYGQGSSVMNDTADVLNTWTGEWKSMTLSTNATKRSIAVIPEHDTIVIAGGYIWPVNEDVVDNVDIFHVEDPLGDLYCTPAEPNSTGQPGELHAVGADLAGDNFVTIQARQLPTGHFGYFLVADSPGFVSHPGGSQGNLCLAGNVGRYSKKIRQVGDDGTFAISPDLGALPTSPPHTVVPGETWSFQAWYRDKNPQITSNFTDAVSITFR